MPLLRLALYQPEIAANVGAAIRTAACFGAELHVIEPCGFPWKARDIDRVARDYGGASSIVRHKSWGAFRTSIAGRVLLMTTKSSTLLSDQTFADGDIILMGQESAGVPPEVHESVDARCRIDLAPEARSLNVAVSAGIALAFARASLGYS